MIDKLFDRDNEVNTGRQIEADIAKALCIIGMVLIHCFVIIQGGSENVEGFVVVLINVLNNIFGASTFMFCMGLGIVYSRSNPVDTTKRGFIIFIIGCVLNVVRSGLPMLIIYAITGKEEYFLIVLEALFNLDILHFAGLALILFGLIRQLKNYRFWLSVIAVLMSAIGSFARGFDTGNYFLNQIVGLFLGTAVAGEETLACFPLFNWFIFVVAGFFFGEILKHCRNKGGFYLRFGTASWVIVIVYMLIAIPNGIGMMSNDINYFYHLTTPEALVSVVAAVAVFSVYYAISHFVKGAAFTFFTTTSKNINTIYCVHWVLLCWIWLPVKYIGGIEDVPTAFVVFFGIILFFVTSTIAKSYKQFQNKRKPIKENQ